MNEFIIIGNGTFLIKEIIVEAIKNKTIVSLDGATNHLYRLGIKPDILLGDFDSISLSVAKHFGIKKRYDELELDEEATPYQQNGITIIPALNQTLTDLTKAIRYCDQQQAASITIICALGGRIDHHENAMRSLRSEYQKQRPILLHTEQQTLRFANNETITFSGEPGDKCGFLAFPKASINSQGLEYEMENFPLEFGFSESVCNTLRSNQATVEVTGEALIIMPPFLPSQREFMQKSAKERLALQLRDA